MRFRKDLACFLVMILTASVVLWLGEVVLAEGVSANRMSVSENTLMTQEAKENNAVPFAADDIANGTDGNITWAIDVDGKLLVSGRGDISEPTTEEWPWYEHRDKIISAFVEITEMRYATYMFNGCSNLVSVDLEHFDTSNVVDMAGMFLDCNNLQNLNLSSFDTSNVTDMSEMFSGCNSLNDVNLSSFDTSNVISMGDMFQNCNSLRNLDLSSFNTANVYGMWSMFYGCSSLLNLDLHNFNTTNIGEMSYMFSECSSLSELDLSNFDTSNVIYMSNMFSGCSSLSKLNLSSFDTHNVTDMWAMFGGCDSLVNLNLSNFDTNNVTNMGSIFNGCESLESLDLSKFDTSNVTNMVYMFNNCSSLKNLNIDNFNTNNVTNMHCMFYGCSSLTNLDLNHFNTSNVTNMRNMFWHCSSLKSLRLDNFDTTNVVDMGVMFSNCSELTNLNLNSFNTSNVTDMGVMFRDCNSLTNLDLSNFDVSNVIDIEDMFLNCNNLSIINTPCNLKKIVKLPGTGWNLEDGTEITELSQNLNYSIKIIRQITQTPDNTTDEKDQWLQVTGVENYNSSTYIAKNSNQSILDTLFDTLYNNTYQTLFINDKTADLSKLAPVFSVGGSIKAYVQDKEQTSGESIQDFSGGSVAYHASNGDETREYFITFAKKESGPKLFVNGPGKREVYLTDYFNNIHDILIANTGDETLTGIKVELLDAAHVKLDDTITTGLGNNNTLSAFTKIPSSGESASVMTNLGKIRLLPDGEGEIRGRLVISADGQAPVYIELSGYSSNPKITTTTTDLNMEDVVRVKYVPYSYTVETNNIDTENTVTFSLEEGRLAEGLQIYPATGEIYGVPLETGEFPIKVKATYSRPEYLPSYADIILTVKDNTDGNVYNASDAGYELVRAVGKETSSGSNDFVLTKKGNQLFVSAGPYHEFVDFWLNGQRLIEGEDYTKESGSTRITVRAQTFANKANAEGTNTFAAEFRTTGDSRDNLRRTAQNFRMNFKKGSSSKSRSDSEENVVVTTAAVSSNVSFAMRLVNPAGLPLSGLTIEVHSTPKVSQTNQNGMAAFYDVESGAHTLFVKDKDGNILASTNFEILFGDAAKLQNMQLTVKSGSRFTLDTQLDGNVLTFVNLQEGDAYRILSADTADNTNMAVWFVLMFVSGGIGFNIYRNNRRKIYRK